MTLDVRLRVPAVRRARRERLYSRNLLTWRAATVSVKSKVESCRQQTNKVAMQRQTV